MKKLSGHHGDQQPLTVLRLLLPVLLLIALPIFVIAMITQQFELRKRAANTPGVKNAIHWETPYAELTADEFYIYGNGQYFNADMVPGSLRVSSDPPGAPSTNYTTLEVTWQERNTGGPEPTEMRFYVYLYRDATSWWTDEIRTYDGRKPGDWIFYNGKKLMNGSLGTQFSSEDFTLEGTSSNGNWRGKLSFKNLRFRAFMNEVSDQCAGKPDGGICDYDDCPICTSNPCPARPCVQKQGVCRMDACVPGPQTSVSPTVIQQQIPDLTVDSFTVTPTGNANEYNISVRVKNTGAFPVPQTAFRVSTYVDPPGAPIPGLPADNYTTWGLGLAPGATFTFAYNKVLSPGQHAIHVWVDSLNQILEMNEDNNKFITNPQQTTVSSTPTPTPPPGCWWEPVMCIQVVGHTCPPALLRCPSGTPTWTPSPTPPALLNCQGQPNGKPCAIRTCYVCPADGNCPPCTYQYGYCSNNQCVLGTPTPTRTPTNTPPSNQSQTFEFRFRYAGVTDGSANGSLVSVRLTSAQRDLMTPSLSATHMGLGIYLVRFTIVSPLPPGEKFVYYLKGEKHVAVKFCAQVGQTVPCQPGAGIVVPSPSPLTYGFDFTGIPLPPGDLPQQDGKADLNDFTQIKNRMTIACSQLTNEDKHIADVDYNGCVTTKDAFLMRKTLETRYDEN